MGARAFTCLLFLAVSQVCDPQPHTAGLIVSSTALGPGNGSECAPFALLDTAIAIALEAGGGTIEVLGSDADQFELSETVVTTAVFLRGKGSSIDLKGRVMIENSALLSIQGLSFKSGNETRGRFEVRGQLVIADSTLTGIDDVVAVYDGVVVVENTTILGCKNVIDVSAAQAFLNVSGVAFQYNHGSLFHFSDELGKSEVEISILGCSFDNNSGQSLITTKINNPLSALLINISECQFLSNFERLFDVSGLNTKVAISLCTFINNRNGGIHIEVVNGDISLANCDWVQHYGKVVEVHQLVGKLALINTTIRRQSSETPVFITNTGDAAHCFVLLSNTTYVDSNWATTNRGAGFLILTSCAASVTGLTIRNVTTAGFFGQFYGLVEIQQGYAEIRHLDIENLESKQALFYVVFSSMIMSDSRVINVASGFNILFILVFNDNITFANFTMKGAVGLSTTESMSLAADGLVYFASNMNYILFKQVDIDAGVGSLILGIIYRDFSAESLTVRNARLRLTIVSTVGATVNLSGLTIKNCTSETILKAKGRITAFASNITIEDSQITKVFQATIFSRWVLFNVVISHSACTTMMQAVSATIQLTNVQILSTSMVYLMRGSAGSLLQFDNATVRDCAGALVEIYGSQTIITDSQFKNLQSAKSLFSQVQSNITLQGIIMRNIQSKNSAMADIRELSNLQVLNSDIRDLNFSNGITLKESSMEVTESIFSGFPFTLIIGQSASIVLVGSRFENGGPVGSNPLLHGGILSCEKCENVNLIGISVMAMHSSQGGGLYLLDSIATVTRSSFRQCSAINGGAVTILNSKFHISDSNFTLCSASDSGGAIDISSSVNNSEISHSGFSFNSAKVGGAVNIRKTLPVLGTVNFAWNTAEYGPDIATYTVAARVASAFQTNVSYMSGNPFPQSLKIELLDHFGQVVLTDNIAQLSFHLPQNIVYGGMAQVVAQKGVIDLGTAPIYSPPNSIVTIFASVSTYSSSINFDFSWKLLFRPCQLGEVTHKDRCEKCPTGKFSLLLNDTECQFCSGNSYCPGGFEIDLNKGFWRTSVNSSELLKCPFSEKCLGGLNSECEEGYTGKLCSECSDDWYRVGTLYCRQCSSISTAIQVIAFFLQYFSIFFIAFYVSEITPNDSRSAALQIWIDYSQCTSMMLRLRIEQPPVLANMYHALAYLGSLSATVLPVSCLFGNERSPYLKMIVISITPVIILLFFVVLAFCRVLVLTQRKMTRLIGIILYFVGAVVVESFGALLLSTKLGKSEHRWLFEDASVESWSAHHVNKLKYIYSPLFCCYILFPLLLLTTALISNRLRKFTAAYCPLFTCGLRSKFFFAQFLIYYWKLLFILITMSVTARDQLLQLTMSLSMLIALIPTIVAVQVYASKQLLFLSVGSKVVVFSSVCSAAYYMENSASDSKPQYFFASALLVLHLLVCCFFAKTFIQGKMEFSSEYAEEPHSVTLINRESPIVMLDPPPNSQAEWRSNGCHTAPVVQIVLDQDLA